MPVKKTVAQKAPKKQKSFEESLWDTANKLRGSVESSEYKHVVLSLIFLKFVSDKFEERRAELVAEGQSDYIDMIEFYTMQGLVLGTGNGISSASLCKNAMQTSLYRSKSSRKPMNEILAFGGFHSIHQFAGGGAFDLSLRSDYRTRHPCLSAVSARPNPVRSFNGIWLRNKPGISSYGPIPENAQKSIYGVLMCVQNVGYLHRSFEI